MQGGCAMSGPGCYATAVEQLISVVAKKADEDKMLSLSSAPQTPTKSKEKKV